MKIPQLRKKPELKSCHNVTWEDNYSWIHQSNILEVLRDSSKLLPEVREYLEKENEYFENEMKDTKELQKKIFDEIKGRIKLDDESLPFKDKQYKYWTKTTAKGNYSIKLTVVNQNGVSDEKLHKIHVNQNKSSKKYHTGSLEDSKEFYRVLEDRKILCKVTHGVIDGPHLNIRQRDLKKWQLDKADTTKINVAIDYNGKICDIVNKCINTYKRKRVLLGFMPSL